MTTSAAQPWAPGAPAGTIGVAVVGCGYWGPNLVRNFMDCADARLVAVCDAAPGRLEPIARRYPAVTMTTRFSDLLDDPAIDAVAIATPVHTHAALARAALEAGKHVLVEKPITTTSGEAEELIALAERRNLTLMVDHTFIYTGAVRRIKHLIETGELGRLYYYDSVRVNLGLIQGDVSVLWDLAVHDLAIMDYLIDAHPIAVGATAAAHFPGGMADIAYLTVQFPDNLLAHFHVNWLSPVKVRTVLLGGDRRMVRYDDLEPTEKVKVYDRGVQWTEDPLEARREKLVAYRVGDVYAPMLDQAEALRTECLHFIECIKTNETPDTDGNAGLRVLRILEAAERSLGKGGQMEPLDD